MGSETEIATTVASEMIKLAFSGSVAVLKVSGKAATHAAALLAAVIADKKQNIGKMKLKDMLKDGVSLVTIKTADKDKFREAMKMYGMKYCLVRNKEKDSKTVDIFIRTMDAPVVKRAMEKYELGIVTQDVKVELEKEQLVEGSLIRISKADFVVEEKGTQIKARVPYTSGDNIRYLYFDKRQVAEASDGSAYMTTIDAKEEYEVFDKSGQMEKMSGDKLLNYYRAMIVKDDSKNSEALTNEEVPLGKDSKPRFKEGDITISRAMNSLVIEENEDEIKTRIPGTYGDGEKHIYFQREDLEEVYGGKSYKIHIDKDKHYTVYDKQGRVADSMTGLQLLGHYDRLGDEKVVPLAKTRPSVKTHMKNLQERDHKNKFNDFNQRTYDFDAMEKELISRSRKSDKPKQPEM